MRYREIGGAKWSAIGLGTWQFGSREWGYGAEYDERTARDIVRRAIDLGVTLIDTAEIYGLGRSERIVGAAIADRRAEVAVASKLFPVLPIASVVPWRARGSARRLGVERLDLYQLHAANPAIPLSRAMAGMRRARAAGLIDHVGVSNLTLTQWQQCERALGGPVLANQVRFSLLARAPERDLLPWAWANDRLLIAYSPLGMGMLSGRYDGSNTPTGYRATSPAFAQESIRRAGPLLTAVRDLAATHGVAPTTIALAWLIGKPNVVAIPGARTVAQLEENLAAAEITLGPGEIGDLDRASAPVAFETPGRRSRLGRLRDGARSKRPSTAGDDTAG